MATKLRLKIIFPVSEEDLNMANWIKQIELNNKTCVLKDGVYIFDIGDGEDTAPRIQEDEINTGWFTEITEPQEFDEWFEQQDLPLLESTKTQHERTWKAGIENDHLKIQQRLHSFKPEYMRKHCVGVEAERIQAEHVWNSIVATLNLEPEDDNT